MLVSRHQERLPPADGTALPVWYSEFRVDDGEQMVMVAAAVAARPPCCTHRRHQPPRFGQVRIDDWTYLMPESECDRFAPSDGYVFQPSICWPAPAVENVLLSMRFARGRMDKARAKHLLDRVGLTIA